MNALVSRRCMLRALAALLAALALPAIAEDKPIQILVGYGAGGGTDVMARLLGVPLGRIAGRPVVVKNVPGAGGQIAASTLLRDGADGLSVLAINHPDLMLAVARGDASFKASDFQVIMVDVQDPRVMLVKSDSDIDSFSTFVKRAKAQPGKMAISVTAQGGQELFAKWLMSKLGLDVTIVGYKGGAEAATALLAGDVQATIGDDFARYALRDKTRALLVASQKKSPRWPEAQTLTAALAPYGIVPPSPDFMSRYGLYVVPASVKTSNPTAYANLQQMLLKARAAPEFEDYIVKNKLDDLSIGKTGEALDPVLAADMAEIGKIK